MGTKNVLILKTHFDSINTRFLNEFLYKNMLWILGSVRIFLCNYVLYSFGLILNYIFRFQVGGDRKTESDQLLDPEIDGFREELANFLFLSYEDVLEPQSCSLMAAVSHAQEDGEKREGKANSSVSMEVHSKSRENEGKEGEIESSVLMDVHFNFHKDGEKSEGETESSGSLEVHSDFPEGGKKSKGETESSGSLEVHSDSPEYGKKSEGETESSGPMEVHFDVPEDGEKGEGETECSVSMKVYSDLPKDVKKEEETENSVLMEVHSDFQESEEKEGEIESSVSKEVHEDEGKEGETESSVLMGIHSDVHEDGKIREEEKSSDLMEADSAISTRKYQYMLGRNIRWFMEEPTAMSFTFREFYVGQNVPVISNNIAFSSTKIFAQKEESAEQPEEEEAEEESVQENEFLGCSTSLEGPESENLKAIKEEIGKESGKSEEKDEKEGSKQEEESAYREKNETEEWKKVLAEMESDEEIEGDFKWEHDDIVEQLKMELRNAKQGGLPTILEEEEAEEEKEEEEEEETEGTESPEEFEDQKLLKIEEKMELEDQMDEIQEVYQGYEAKMRKLDILNYQTMHGLGLLQLKDPLKSTFPGAKPVMSQNRWARREAKKASDPVMKLVGELQRDLELVYVGQVCLSWEMLCWQHNKAHHLQQHHSHSQFNIAAGEFQLFQVLLQRFIENEPFQGPRTHNFVKNRCVIRNLLQVPPITDDSMKEKNMGKGDEENAVCSGRLAEIIKESMWLFWRFVRADKDDGHLILRSVSQSHQTRTHLKDPAISDLVKDIRTRLRKKERKLKDMVRSGNCIVRKLQKQRQQHEEQLNHEQLLAQVGLRLVSRVLNMSKLRKDHLIWCDEKLNRIKIVKKKKKILVEPSFLLFPY